jgi:hypothetical protein
MQHKTGGGKNRPQKKNDFTLGMMIFFLACCAAEVYLLVVRRFYIDGLAEQVVAWDGILQKLTLAGLGVLVLGIVAVALWRKASEGKRSVAYLLLAAGVFLAGSGWLIRTFYPSGVELLCVLVPAVMVWGILWKLYDRECVYSLTLLALTMLAVWVCRHGLKNLFWGKWVLAGACVYIVLVLAAGFLFHKAENAKGVVGKVRILPAGAGYTAIYACCGLSVIAVVLALLSTTIAYYALWALALVIFGLAVYYTVKQL